jgi:hypothetical protein
MRKRIILFLTIVLCSLVLVTVPSGCGLLHPSAQKKVEKKQALENKKADKEYAKARKQHMDNQNKETKVMMKKTKKRSTVVNKPKKRSFFSSKKCK